MASTWVWRMGLSPPKPTSKYRQNLMWFTYILECEDKSLYTGCTNDLIRRFKQHSTGVGGKYTASHKPVKILFFEEHSTRSDALKRESQIKGWPHVKKLDFILSQNKPA